jgi:fatty acid amide hydrolase
LFGSSQNLLSISAILGFWTVHVGFNLICYCPIRPFFLFPSSHIALTLAYGGINVHDYWNLQTDLAAYRVHWSDAFVASGLDALIYPAMPIPAVPHGMSKKLTMTASYMFIANLLMWPCGSVPVTVVGDNEQHYRFKDIPENQRDEMARLTQKVMDHSSGMPLSINIMTPSFHDETCLRVMKEVERVVQFNHEPRNYRDSN